MKRTPIVRRIPIILNNDGIIFQTIASYREDYEAGSIHVMGEYPTIEIARHNYTNDINQAQKQGYKHFGIRKFRKWGRGVNK